MLELPRSIPYRRPSARFSNNNINWWPGRLRPYESMVSFTANFCALNGIVPRNFDKYIDFKDRTFDNRNEYLEYVAQILGEDTVLVEATFDGLPDLENMGSYRLNSPPVDKKIIQYCPRCICEGYHSYLNDLVWLERCPFHLIPLRRMRAKYRYQAFTELFSKNCLHWPFISLSCVSSQEHLGYAKILVKWINGVHSKIKKFQKDEIWFNLNYEDPHNEDLKYWLGRLCCIENLPAPLSYLVADYLPVKLLVKPFSKKGSAEIFPIINRYTFLATYEAYKIIKAQSLKPLERFTLYRQKIASLHNTPCEWRRYPVGFENYYWVNFEPNPRSECNDCPNLIVQQELQIEWGLIPKTLHTRTYRNHQRRFLELVDFLRESGLFAFKQNAEVSPSGKLWLSGLVFSSCEWRHTVLERFFDILANSELDLFFARKSLWLSNINSGEEPEHCPKLYGSVRVIYSEGRLKVLTWKVG